jgi:transposase
MAGRSELNDKQWAMVEPVLRAARRADNRGRPWHDTRSVLNGVLLVLGTGAQWRALPEKYPPFQTCHRRVQNWIRKRKAGTGTQGASRALARAGRTEIG